MIYTIEEVRGEFLVKSYWKGEDRGTLLKKLKNEEEAFKYLENILEENREKGGEIRLVTRIEV